jgi:hypothetical protein
MMCKDCKTAGILLKANIKNDGSMVDSFRKVIEVLHTACKTMSCTCQHKIGKYRASEDAD